MSPVTTAVPSGLITTDWCIHTSVDLLNQPRTCAKTTIGQTDADFETICCNGDIVDVAKDLFAWPRPRNQTRYIDLEDMVCCGLHGPQAGGIGPMINLATACTTGQPTPLASLAATNTENAPLYAVTFSSASFGGSTTGDFIPTTMPSCLWVYTKTGIALQNITVPAAQITSLPAGAIPGFPDEPALPTGTASDGAASSPSSGYTQPADSVTTASATSSSSVLSSAGSKLPRWGLALLVLAFGTLCMHVAHV